MATRRQFIGTGAATLAMPAILTARSARATGTRPVSLQLSWLPGIEQLGEIAAKRLGYFEAEGIELRLQPGGPSNDGIALVAGGRADIGQISSSPQLMMARGQGIPLTAFATVGQQHPFAFFSLPAKPVRTPKDMIGKRIGVQTTAQFLLSALLKKNGIEENQITKLVLGSDLSPLATGQVDAITGWETSVRALKVLGPDYVTMRLWDQGIRLYANICYAQGERLATDPQTFAAFLRAAGKGWAFARENPGKAVALLVEEMPNLTAEQEMLAAGVMLKYVFTGRTRDHGWGSFEPGLWAEQIALYDSFGQFPKGPPKLDEVMTTKILDLTAAARPKLG